MRKSKTGLSPHATALILSAAGMAVDERAIGEFRDHLLAIATPIENANDLAYLVKISRREYGSIRKRDVNFQKLKRILIEYKAMASTCKNTNSPKSDAFDDFLTRYSVTEQFGIVERFRRVYPTAHHKEN